MERSGSNGHRARLAAILVAAAVGGAGLTLGLGSSPGPTDLVPGAATLRVAASAGPAASESALERTLREFAVIADSDIVLSRIVEDPTTAARAPKWAGRFTLNNAIDSDRALADLRARTTARVIPGTALLELRVDADDKQEAAALTQAAARQLLAWAAERNAARRHEGESAGHDARKAADDARAARQLQIERVIAEARVDFEDFDEGPTGKALAMAEARRLETQCEIAAIRAQAGLAEQQAARPDVPASPETRAALGAQRSRLAELEAIGGELSLRIDELRNRMTDLRRVAERIDGLRDAPAGSVEARGLADSPRAGEGFELEEVQPARAVGR
ncbi:hypothetical protein PHYC_01008 [Phycisphaerales bacterium]|nr:hypothetical protein PHYC_01008 [Phycisphaerales bacterium]